MVLFFLFWTLKYDLYGAVNSETPPKAPGGWCHPVKLIGTCWDLQLAGTHPAGLGAALGLYVPSDVMIRWHVSGSCGQSLWIDTAECLVCSRSYLYLYDF